MLIREAVLPEADMIYLHQSIILSEKALHWSWFCLWLGWKRSDVESHSYWCDLRFQEMTYFCHDQPCSTISCFFYWLINVNSH
ncbi:hypothetical protein P8452_33881 [Trifolium repens]|nr:hypothetical protein P8452_33881 [Trifolium repens]